jgi:hypothetical protein
VYLARASAAEGFLLLAVAWAAEASPQGRGTMKGKTKSGRGVKDLKRRKLSVSQQAAVKGGITDGTSNTIMVGEVVPRPVAKPVQRRNGAALP